MKKPPSKRRTREMRVEYDFSGGVRGKYVDRYRRGINVVLDASRKPQARMIATLEADHSRRLSAWRDSIARRSSSAAIRCRYSRTRRSLSARLAGFIFA